MLYHGPRHVAGRDRTAMVSLRAGLFAMVTRSFPGGLSCLVLVPREAMVVASRRAAPVPLRSPPARITHPRLPAPVRAWADGRGLVVTGRPGVLRAGRSRSARSSRAADRRPLHTAPKTCRARGHPTRRGRVPRPK